MTDPQKCQRKTHAVSHFASELRRTISMSPVNDHMCKWMNNKLELVSAAQEKPSDVAHISLNLCMLPAIIKASGEWPGGKESNPRTRSEKWFKFALKINNMVMWIHVVILPTFMTELCRKVMWIIKEPKKKKVCIKLIRKRGREAESEEGGVRGKKFSVLWLLMWRLGATKTQPHGAVAWRSVF